MFLLFYLVLFSSFFLTRFLFILLNILFIYTVLFPLFAGHLCSHKALGKKARDRRFSITKLSL